MSTDKILVTLNFLLLYTNRKSKGPTSDNVLLNRRLLGLLHIVHNSGFITTYFRSRLVFILSSDPGTLGRQTGHRGNRRCHRSDMSLE